MPCFACLYSFRPESILLTTTKLRSVPVLYVCDETRKTRALTGGRLVEKGRGTNNARGPPRSLENCSPQTYTYIPCLNTCAALQSSRGTGWILGSCFMSGRCAGHGTIRNRLVEPTLIRKNVIR